MDRKLFDTSVDDKDADVKVASTTASSIPSSESESRPDTTDAFDTSVSDEFYKPIDSYEGAHRWDPSFTWSAEEEKAVVRKIDWRICTWVCFNFFALQLDRGNISQAVSDNMLPELGMNRNDYNNGQLVFYLVFLVCELPSQMVAKKLGPDRWIPIQMISWSVIAACQAFLSGKTSFFVCRALLGVFEGGFIPDNVLYLSYWYKGNELPTRLSFFWSAYGFTFIVSGFLAYGIFHMEGVNGLPGWRWLFALEGLFTGLIGITSYFYLPPSPTQTASFFRGRSGWFNEREEKIMVNRVLRDDPSKGDMHNRQAIDWNMFWKCLKDTDMWPVYLVGITLLIPSYPLQQYLTLQLTDDGFTTFQSNLLSIPAWVIFIVMLLLVVKLSNIFDERVLMCMAHQIWCMAFLIALEVLPDNANKWARWICTVCIVGAPYVHPILVGLTSRNAGTVRTRSVASAIYNMTIQAGNIIGTQIYQDKDKPYYRVGNKALIGLAAWNIVMLVGTKMFYIRKNKKRSEKWNGMGEDEKAQYLATTKDEGNRRLDFKFAH